MIEEHHARQVTAHCGRTKTYQLIQGQYYWPGLRAEVNRYIDNCKVCRWITVPRDKTPGWLHPLPIPDRPWQHVSIDFKSFPKDRQGYDNALVVVCRLGKRAYSIPCKKNATAKDAAELYYDRIWRIYGWPETMTSDRGPQFISAFTDELCKLSGTKQKLSTASHPQTDGNTEIINQYIDQRLRPFVNHHQDNWSKLLPSIDFAQAVLPHESTGISPFELEFGYKPRMQYDWRERTDLSDRSLSPTERMTREAAQEMAKRAHDAWKWARDHLRKAQERQARQANKKRREVDFDVGDYVYVTAKNWTTDRPSTKLELQRRGPYKILEKVGHSFRLDLPPEMKIHPVLHADRLRKAPMNPLPGQYEDPEPATEVGGEQEWEVERIKNSRLVRGRLEYQADWKGWDPDNRWYPAENFKNSPLKLRDFHADYPDKPGPPVRLQRWIDAAASDEFDPDHKDDSKAEKEGTKRTTRKYGSRR